MKQENYKILIIDDDRNFLQEVKEGLGNVFELFMVTSFERAQEELSTRVFDLILLDLVFNPDADPPEGLEYLKVLKENYPLTPVIIITQFGDSGRFTVALEYGADQYLRKESSNFLSWQEVIEAEIIKYKRLTSGLKDLQTIDAPVAQQPSIPKIGIASHEQKEEYPFLGDAPKIQKIRKELIALSDEPDISVLILGETGVGKEVAARFLHSHGVRNTQPFVAVNIAAINKELIQSTLFGHRKGSFTGAIDNQKGAFELAHGGVLFLDEIGELEPDMQPKILRALENKEITPVGGKLLRVDIQIIAATNRDLKTEIKKGTFRADLYHRLNDFAILLPPLRERFSDLRLLAEHYLAEKGEEASVFSDEVWQYFYQYTWPGNVRELVSVIRALLIKRKVNSLSVVDASYLPDDFFRTEKREIHSFKALDIGDIPTSGDMEYDSARRELMAIELAFQAGHNKSKIVEEMKFESLDQLRYRIVEKYFDKYKTGPLFKEFPLICRKYKLHV